MDRVHLLVAVLLGLLCLACVVAIVVVQTSGHEVHYALPGTLAVALAALTAGLRLPPNGGMRP